MSIEPNQSVILIPKHLSDAIEWVLKRKKDNPPDLSRLTSAQMQLLPLSVAEAFMELTLAARQPPPAPASYSGTRALWADARATQRARRNRQRASSLTAAHHRLHTWYVQTGSAQRSGFAKAKA